MEKFKKGKLLGQGGQGTVHMGTYDGVIVAGKTFLGTPDASLVQEVLDEVCENCLYQRERDREHVLWRSHGSGAGSLR